MIGALGHRPVHMLYSWLHRNDAPIFIWGLPVRRACPLCRAAPGESWVAPFGAGR